MKIFRSLLIVLAMLSLIACGDDGGSLNGEDLVDSGVEDDAAVKPPPGEDDEDEEGDPKDDDPGDGDDDDPGDGDDDDDDGEGPGEPTDPDVPATLSFVVVDEESQPYVGATVRLLGHEIDPEVSDADGRVEFEVPRLGEYQALIEGMGDDWSYGYPLSVVENETRPSILTMPSDVQFSMIGALTGVPVSEDDGLVFFIFETREVGGQSVEIEGGVAFIQITNEADPEDITFIPSATLTADAEPTVAYLNVPPSALSPIFSTPIPNESCDAIFSPPGGWASLPRTLLIIPVNCVRDDG